VFGGTRSSNTYGGNNTDTYYAMFYSRDESNSSSDNRTTIVPGTVSQFRASVTVAPGAGNSWIFTLYINDSASSVSCTIAETATSCTNMVNSAVVPAGGTVMVRADPVSDPASGARHAFAFALAPNP
jgi:hypothetical protein